MSIVTVGGVAGVHPLGDGVYSFPTAGGRVHLSVTEDALTPYGGLVPWAALHAVPETAWQGPAAKGAWQLAECS